MKTLLVPVDFSEASMHAWEQARKLASKVGAKIECVHVAPFALMRDRVRMAELSPKQRRRLLGLLSLNYPGAAAVHLEQGDVVLGILRTARRRKASMIAMATGGRTGLKRLHVPSMAEEVVRSSPIPVMSVQGPGRPIRSILAPVNLKPYSFAGLRSAHAMAAALDADLTVLFVEEAAGSRPLARRRIELELASLKPSIKASVKVSSGQALQEILVHAPRHGLVVMTVHRKGILSDAVLGSTAEQVLRRVRVPVLSVPPSA